MSNKNFIFLAGHHRSGTSLLHEIIREHTSISGFSNTGVPEDEGKHLQAVFKPAKAYGGPGKYIFNSESHMTESHALATDESAEAIMEQWGKHYDSSCAYYIEKSPPNLVRTRFFQKLFPESKFVAILRHPLAVSFATQKWSKTSIKSLIDHTLLGYEFFAKDMKHLNNAYVLRYEDLVKDPQSEVNKIFRFLDLDPLVVKHDVRANVNDKYFLMWENNRKTLLNRIKFKIEDDLEERMNQFGYSITDYRSLLPCSLVGAHHKVQEMAQC